MSKKAARKRRRQDSRRQREAPHWLLPPLVGAIAGALVTAAITTGLVSSVWHLATSPFRSAPSDIERVVNTYENGVREESFWQGPPALYPRSRSFFIHHMRLLDPYVTHVFIPSWTLTVPSQLLPSVPDHIGELVIVYGRVLGANAPQRALGGAQVIVVQLIDANIPWPLEKEYIGPIVDCAVPFPKGTIITPGTTLFGEGVVIAAGNAIFSLGGFRPMAWLACDAAVAPQGPCGRGYIPPLPNTQKQCPGRLAEYVRIARARGIHNTVQ